MTNADLEKQPKRGNLMKVNPGIYDAPAKGEKPTKSIGEPAKPMKSGELF